MGIPEHWLTYLYQFGVGGFFFAAGLVLIIKTGACNLKIRADRIWFSALVAGYLFLASLYAVWIYASVHTPSVAEGGGLSTSVSPLRAIPVLIDSLATVARALIELL